jgi:DNA-3-methyladenine glycosylase I
VTSIVYSGNIPSEATDLMEMGSRMPRCDWATNDLAIRYHDEEWGMPVHDDRRWFEFLVLEGAQAGLSWDTILKKRETYRTAFDDFDPDLVAMYDIQKVESLLADPGIIRNRLKVASAIKNAGAFLEVQRAFGTFDAYIWRHVDGRPIVNSWITRQDVPARTAESDALSKDLKRRGFSFVGSTICYAMMQATGMVNDHLVGCFRHAQVG